MGSMLLAREVPPYGGDTMFANQYLAYEALSDGLKADARRACRRQLLDQGRRHQDARGPHEGGRRRDSRLLTAEHPIVRTHPETGRKALYTSSAHTAHIKGWTEKESLPLLRFLWEHQVRPEFTCRFRWEPGSLAFWDNRCAMHNPINDYHGHRRVMHRITLAGDKPR